MQVERVLGAGFQIWENKADHNNVVGTEAVSGNANEDENAAYQPGSRVVSSPTPVGVVASSPQSILAHQQQQQALQNESQKKRSPVSLVADKYMILDELEGSSLNMCVNIHTKEDYVCKVSTTGQKGYPLLLFPSLQKCCTGNVWSWRPLPPHASFVFYSRWQGQTI